MRLASSSRVADGQPNFASLGEFDGVADEVEQDLAELAGISSDGGKRRRIENEPNIGLSRRKRQHQLEDVLDDGGERKLRLGPVRARRPRSWNSRGCRRRPMTTSDPIARSPRHMRRASQESGVRRKSSASPRMPWMGVRISWLIVARNADFARSARSASSRARRYSVTSLRMTTAP